ncbi:hypothetical protein C8R47DRAFT_1062713 [Mycena vitilis]|nr:hypothetical protein C8R47DRAFT_1078691 [Mycena vitilis]KAJ6518175.1 hypothetical protein C8R47DRAFT_1062713 [Mycena vitilis]
MFIIFDEKSFYILHLVSKLTDDKNSPNLQQPLLPSLPPSFQEVTSHAPGKANVPDSNPAYRIVFAPGLIVVADAFNDLDPVQPADNRVKLDVIAMEFYKQFKGSAPPSDLKWVMRIHIANSLSQACFESVYEANGRGAEAGESDTEWVRWDFTTDRDAIAMLLGTDNGVASTFILQDYKATLGGRTIVAVYTRVNSRTLGRWRQSTHSCIRSRALEYYIHTPEPRFKKQRIGMPQGSLSAEIESPFINIYS